MVATRQRAEPALECRGVLHRYGRGAAAAEVLKGARLDLGPGELGVLRGPSGSGKTTLLSILGCLLTPTDGEVRVTGRRVDGLSAAALARVRRHALGFVFQHAQLVPFLTVEENLLLVGRNAGVGRDECRRRAAELLAGLGLPDVRAKRPDTLSGGQRQRVAVARALIHRPAVVLADEPTAALDWENGQAVIRLLMSQAPQHGAAVLVVTHDSRVVRLFDRQFDIRDGVVYEQF